VASSSGKKLSRRSSSSATFTGFWSGGGEIWGVGSNGWLHAVGGVFSFVRMPLGGDAVWGSSPSSLVSGAGFGEIAVSFDDGVT
jgi:hypothetical protein